MSSQRTRVVFLDAATYGDVSLQRFTESWDCTVHQVTTSNETMARIAGHSVVVTNKVVIDGTVLKAPEARELKLIAVAATGTDIIDREEAARRGIKVCNVPGYAAQSVAQFTMALILELATRVGKYGEAVKAGEWQKSPVFSLLTYPSVELNGKKLGIVGYGNIGQTVAKMARGFVDQRAARRVDQECRRLHQGQRLLVDQVPVLRRERAVKRDDIRSL